MHASALDQPNGLDRRSLHFVGRPPGGAIAEELPGLALCPYPTFSAPARTPGSDDGERCAYCVYTCYHRTAVCVLSRAPCLTGGTPRIRLRRNRGSPIRLPARRSQFMGPKEKQATGLLGPEETQKFTHGCIDASGCSSWTCGEKRRATGTIFVTANAPCSSAFAGK